jgi:chromosome segregation ATPase
LKSGVTTQSGSGQEPINNTPPTTQDKSDYEEKLKKLMEKLTEEEEKGYILERKVNDLETERKNIRAENTSLNKTKDDLNNQIRTLKTNHDRQVKELESKLKTAEEEAKKVGSKQTDVDKYKKLFEDEKTKYEDVKTKRDDEAKLHEKYKKTAEQTVEDLKRKAAADKDQIDKQINKLADLSHRLTESDQKSMESTRKLTESESKNNVLNEELQKLLKERTKDIPNADELIRTLTQQKVDEIESQKKTSDAEIGRLQSLILSKDLDLMLQNQELIDLKTKLSDIEKELKGLKEGGVIPKKVIILLLIF